MAVELMDDEVCPCGLGVRYGDCCGALHSGRAVATTPEQLMRSRYSAYVLLNDEYLRHSWHASTRPAELDLTPTMQWLGLTITDAPLPILTGSEGWVEFNARFLLAGRIEHLRERSRFLYEQGRWFYVDGQLQPQHQKEIKPVKIGRNEPCPCGSGRKYKQCCGSAH